MDIFKMLEVIFVIGAIIFMFFTMIYAYSVINKCSIEESVLEFKSIIRTIVRALFKNKPKPMFNIRIGANDDGYIVPDIILLKFADLDKEFKSFYLNRMPEEYDNYIVYSFIAKFPINISSDYIDTLTKFIKAITESIVKKYLLEIGMDINVSGLVAVRYNIESGKLYIAIAKNQEGIYSVGNFNISVEKNRKVKELKSLQKKEMIEEWKDNN